MLSPRDQDIRNEFDERGQSGGIAIARLRASIIAFYRGSFAERGSDILTTYRAWLDRTSGSVELRAVDGRRPHTVISRAGLQLLPFWCAEVDDERLRYGLALADTTTDEHFAFYQDGELLPGFVRFEFPVETMLENPSSFEALTTRLLGSLPILHGWAGFSFAGWALGDPYVARDLGRRYTCVDLLPPHYARFFAEGGLLNLGWLTLIGDDLLAHEDAERAVAALRDIDGVWITPTPFGLVIGVGSSPTIGDVNRGDLSHCHSRVAAALRPLRLSSAGIELMFQGDGSNRYMREWLARFDGVKA